MSADRWGTCPKCKKKWDADTKQAKLDCAEAYGKIPSEEYLERLAKVCNPVDLEETLRQDWSITVSNSGEFEIEFSCFCRVCKLQYTYAGKEQIKI